MRTVSYRIGDLNKAVIHIGRVAENEYTRVQIDAGEIFAEYPAASASLTVQPPEGSAYPATVTRDGNLVIWDVKDSDLTADGNGEIQLTFTNSSVVVKSAIGRISVCRSIVASGEAPDPVQDWISDATDVLEALEDAIPEGGTQGQVLAKASDDDYDLEWVDQTGGGGGTGDYNDLTNKPKINNVTLSGNNSLSDLGIASASDLSAKYSKPSGGIPSTDLASGVLTSIIDDTAGDGDTGKVWSADKCYDTNSALQNAITQKQDALTFDNSPTENSDNPVKSGGIYSALSQRCVTPQQFGAKADGTTDDSDSIQDALDEGGLVYLPAGRYMITKTLSIKSNTTLMGAGDDSVIVLGDNGSHLTGHYWYPVDVEPDYPDYYPYITTKENASRIRISRIRVEGNTSSFSSDIHVGICAESATDIVIDNVSVWKINYHPEDAPARPSGQYRTGWNIAFLRSKRVELSESTIQYGGYECVRIGPTSENIWVHDCLIEYGWRTGLQVIRGCKDVYVERCTINQDDFDAYDTNACITLHANDNAHIGHVVVRNCKLTGELYTGNAGGAGISEVQNGVDLLTIEDTEINITASGLSGINLYGSTEIYRCNISTTYQAIQFTANSASDNVVVEDSTITTVHNQNVPSLMIYGNGVVRHCIINSAYAGIYARSHNSAKNHLIVEGSTITLDRAGNSILIEKASTSYGARSFEIVGNVLGDKIYIDQKGDTVERNCIIAENTITPHASSGSKRSIQCPSTATTAYKMLTIRDNVFVSGTDGATLNSTGIVVATGNNAAGCNNGFTGTNANNIIINNILP